MAEKILIIGSTGYIGKFIAKASVALGHPTFLLVRPSASEDATKAEFLESIKKSGAKILHGSLEDHASLVSAIKQVDVVISAVGGAQLADQDKIIAAIKEAGNIKRFLPSEFGNDLAKMKDALPVMQMLLGVKLEIRKKAEQAGVPYTVVSTNSFAGYFLANLAQAGHFTPPRDKVTIYGDGNTKAVFVDEVDIGTYVIKAAVDPRTLNKTVYLRPEGNVLSMNEVVAIWEKKIGKELEKSFISAEELLKSINESSFPNNIAPSFTYSILVAGDQTNFDIDLEATQLYPDVAYTTVDAYLSRFV